MGGLMSKMNLTILPTMIVEHLNSSVSEAWRKREEEAYARLLSVYSESDIINAFYYLKASGIPPYGEVTREPLLFLSENTILIESFNKSAPKAAESSMRSAVKDLDIR